MTYHPEQSIAELRAARDHGHETFAEMYEICERAAASVKAELWPDPADREQAGQDADEDDFRPVPGPSLAALHRAWLDRGLPAHTWAQWVARWKLGLDGAR